MKVTPIEANTRIRSDHNTAGTIVDYAQPGNVVTGEEVFTAPVDFTYNGVVIQFQSDRWLKVLSISGSPASGWIAITNKGIEICHELPIDLPPSEEYIIHVKDGVERKFVLE